jgi:hypothetical protein
MGKGRGRTNQEDEKGEGKRSRVVWVGEGGRGGRKGGVYGVCPWQMGT